MSICFSGAFINAPRQVRGLHAGIGAHLRGRAAGDHLPVDHHGELVGQREHRVHVVLDQQDAVVFLDGQQQGDHALGFGHAHAGQRLVEQQHLRLGGQRHRDFELALFAVADGAGDAVLAVLQAGQFQRAFGAGVDGGKAWRA
jgi:hypothetical protein